MAKQATKAQSALETNIRDALRPFLTAEDHNSPTEVYGELDDIVESLLRAISRNPELQADIQDEIT